MAEIGDIVKIGIAVFAIALLGLIVVGFYFTVVSSPGQQFLVGGFEGFASAVFQAIESPFIAIGKFITGIPSKLGFVIGARLGV
jgi:hypothetical protein